MFVAPSGSASPESALKVCPPKGSSIAIIYTGEMTEESKTLARTVQRRTQSCTFMVKVTLCSLLELSGSEDLGLFSLEKRRLRGILSM